MSNTPTQLLDGRAIGEHDGVDGSPRWWSICEVPRSNSRPSGSQEAAHGESPSCWSGPRNLGGRACRREYACCDDRAQDAPWLERAELCNLSNSFGSDAGFRDMAELRSRDAELLSCGRHRSVERTALEGRARGSEDPSTWVTGSPSRESIRPHWKRDHETCCGVGALISEDRVLTGAGTISPRNGGSRQRVRPGGCQCRARPRRGRP